MEKKRLSDWLKTHWEWASVIGTIYMGLLVSHTEIVRVENRLDARASEISQRADAHIIALNQRCDDLHREFYELLKELRREEKRG